MLLEGSAIPTDRQVQEKVSCLERRVQKQERELVSLRIALAELLRTLHKLEAGKAIPYSVRHHARHPSNGSEGSTSGFRSRSSTPSSGVRVTFSPPTNGSSPTDLKSSASCFDLDSSPSPPANSNLNGMKKWSHSQDLASSRRSNSGSLLNIQLRSGKPGGREAIFNPDEGWVKVHIRGRPLIFPVPTDHLSQFRTSRANSAPLSQLRLDWVYGYRGKDCRANLHWLPTGEVVYPAASVVVMLNVEEGLQRHYTGHKDEVKCLAVHPNKMIIATGQVAHPDRRERRCRQLAIDLSSPDSGHWAQVQVWDSVNLHTVQVLGIGDFERAVNCLSFSQQNGGTILAVIDDSPDHTLSIWDWQKGFKVSETKCSMSPVLAAEFHNQDPHCLVTAGRNHVHFWDTRGGALSKRVGVFERTTKPKFIHCIAFTDSGDLLTGDSSNQIMVWTRGTTRVARVISTNHDGGIYSLAVLKDSTVISGGGKDGRILQWDAGLERTGKEVKLPDYAGGVRTLSQGKGSRILVGTTKNCILQGTFTFNFATLIQSHVDEVTVLARHPHRPIFLTAGQDRQLILWDAGQHTVLWSRTILEVPRSACFSPDGGVLVVGTLRGRWMVMDTINWATIYSHLESVDAVLHVAFSPDGRYLALGSADRCIYVYEATEGYRKYSRVGRCMGHSGGVRHFDWCLDNTHLQSVSDDTELLFWNAKLCRQVTQSAIIRDLKPAEHVCSVGYNVFGAWLDPHTEDPTCCHRSVDGNLLAVGYESGTLRLFSYPANRPRCLSHTYTGHGSSLSQVKFLTDNTTVISVGGKDCTLLQWKIF